MMKQPFTEGYCAPPTVGKEEVLGKGACGTVVKVYVSDPGGFSRLQAGQYIADKKIAMTNFTGDQPARSEKTTGQQQDGEQKEGSGSSSGDDESYENIRREIAMLKTLRHKNIVEYYGVHLDTTGYLHIFMEYCEGNSLRHVYKKNGPLSDAVVQSYTYQLLEGLKFLHARGIVHRDIKGFNVLLARNGDCKLADFGSAVNLANKKDQEFQSVEGTVYWMAPEVLQIGSHTQGASFAADLWSVGCTVLEMLTACTPFSHCKGDFLLVKHVLETPEDQLILPEVAELISADSLSFIRRCLRRDPKERPTAAQLQEDPYFASYVERKANQPGSPGQSPRQSPVVPQQIPKPLSTNSAALLQPNQVRAKMQSAYTWWVEEATQGTGSTKASDLFANHFKCTSLLPELLPFLKYPNKVIPEGNNFSTQALGETVVNSEEFLRFIEWFGPLRTFLQDCHMFDAQAQRDQGGMAERVKSSSFITSVDGGYGTYGGAYGYGSYGTDDDVHMLLTLKTRSWFQPLLNQKEAERAILPRPTETFAIRFSSKYDHHPGSFTLSIRGKGGVNHYRILRPEDEDSWAFVLITMEGGSAASQQPGAGMLKQDSSALVPTSSSFTLPNGGGGLYFDSLENLVLHGSKKGVPSLKHPDQVYKFSHPLPLPTAK